MVTKHGNNLFYRDVNLRLLCCQVRKVLPLRRALMNYDAWVTGLQPRPMGDPVEYPQDRNRSRPWRYRQDRAAGRLDRRKKSGTTSAPTTCPTTKLYDKGYKSIGCAPCTRAVAEGDDSRAGRWWWETGAPKECGMHCAIETGGFEHELAALLGQKNGDLDKS